MLLCHCSHVVRTSINVQFCESIYRFRLIHSSEFSLFATEVGLGHIYVHVEITCVDLPFTVPKFSQYLLCAMIGDLLGILEFVRLPFSPPKTLAGVNLPMQWTCHPNAIYLPAIICQAFLFKAKLICRLY